MHVTNNSNVNERNVNPSSVSKQQHYMNSKMPQAINYCYTFDSSGANLAWTYSLPPEI
jgi:hypothetical protein